MSRPVYMLVVVAVCGIILLYNGYSDYIHALYDANQMSDTSLDIPTQKDSPPINDVRKIMTESPNGNDLTINKTNSPIGNEVPHTSTKSPTGNDVMINGQEQALDNDVTDITESHGNDVIPECTKARRVELIRERCERLGLKKTISEEELLGKIARRKIGNFMINQAQRVMQCPIPKVGSSTMAGLLLSAGSKNKSVSNRIHAFYDEDHDPSELAEYYRYVLVRHPFTRLVSAFNDKFAYPGQNFVERYRKGVIHERFDGHFVPDVDGELRMTWEQFLDLLATEPKRFVNQHWESYMSMCDPCLMNFEHVMRLETMDADMKPLLERLELPHDTHVNAKRNTSVGRVADQLEHVSEIFRKVPDNIMQGIMRTYGLDLEVYGYTWDNKKGAGCAVVTKDNMCC